MSKKYKKIVTKYGEFVPSFHKWIGLEEQKERAKELEKMTEDEK